jgi:hypothetical protein
MRRAIILLILSAVLICWRYSGAKEVIIKEIKGNIITMTNDSEWMVYNEDLYRAKTWGEGDEVKLIYSKGFWYFDFLALNLYRNDVCHVKCVGDGK